MGRAIHKLSTKEIERRRDARALGDGGGLWLFRSGIAAASWVFRFARQGKSHDLGLGPYPEITLQRARDKAAELRRALAEGQDVLADRRPVIATGQIAQSPRTGMSFAEAAAKYIAAMEKSWTRESTHQWTASLANYAHEHIGGMSVAAVDTANVLAVLTPIWSSKTETASRIRGRIEKILDWAKAQGLRNGHENPARWVGHLENLLPRPDRLAKVEHFKAVPVTAMPGFIARLRERSDVTARALEFLTLTACRSGEVRGARWDEINLAEAVWTIPANRMKARKAHTVPLTARAIAILAEVAKVRRGDYVFPGKRNALGSIHGLDNLMGDIGEGASVHWLRSTFRDWCGENGKDRILAEMSLAHKVGNDVERSYARSDLLARRRELMDAWAEFCG